MGSTTLRDCILPAHAYPFLTPGAGTDPWAYLEQLEREAALGRSYLKGLRQDLVRLACLSDQELDGALYAQAAEKLTEPELLELKRVYGAQAARRFPPVPQLRSRGAAKTEDETEFLI